MPKAKLSQVAHHWVDEDPGLKKSVPKQEKNSKRAEEQPKKKQTFSLRVDTIKRLWVQRVKTGKTLSETMDELVFKHLPVADIESVGKKEKSNARS